MFEDQFGNKLSLGDVVIYTSGVTYTSRPKPTLAKVTKICAELTWRGKESSYISVKPLVARPRYTRDGTKTTYELECSRPLQKVGRIIKVDKSMLENLIGTEPVVKPM